MSQTFQQKQIEYFTKYAGSCLKIWDSIIGQQITHYSAGLGTVIGIKKIDNSIYVEVQFMARKITKQEPKKFLGFGKEWNMSKVFTHLTLPREVKKDVETRYWDSMREDLIYELRDLVSHSPIDQSTYNNFDETYNRLMGMNQRRKFPEKTIQKINEYKQKLMDRKRFSNLYEKAMNPNVMADFPLPVLNEDDIQLVEKWCKYSLDRKSLVEDESKDWKLGRLLSARSAEKIAMDFYQNYGKEVKDISITQIDENNNSDWSDYDLNVDGLPVDVKNSRRSQKSKDRYTEHCIPSFKNTRRTNQEVRIAGVFSPYLWAFELLDKPIEHHQDREIQFLGETTIEKQQALKIEFNDLVYFSEPSLSSKYFLPPWVFDYPEYVYTERDNVLKELKGFSNLALLKDKPDLIPVAIAASIDLTKILDKEALDHWKWCFLDQLSNRIERYGLSLPFLFLSILEHFLDMAMAASPKTVSDFKPEKYREFLFCKELNKPLGIYDPLKTIDALIETLGVLWTAENELIRKLRVFRLISFNMLQGKSNQYENLWTTLIAYCGGRLPDGSACGKNPLVLGESELCEHCKLICPDCRFCCKKCEEERSPTSSSHTPTGGFKPAGRPAGTSGTGESDFAI